MQKTLELSVEEYYSNAGYKRFEIVNNELYKGIGIGKQIDRLSEIDERELKVDKEDGVVYNLPTITVEDMNFKLSWGLTGNMKDIVPLTKETPLEVVMTTEVTNIVKCIKLLKKKLLQEIQLLDGFEMNRDNNGFIYIIKFRTTLNGLKILNLSSYGLLKEVDFDIYTLTDDKVIYSKDLTFINSVNVIIEELKKLIG